MSDGRYPPPDYLRMALDNGADPPFDRDLTTYRIGERILVPALAGLFGNPRTTLRSFGAQSTVSRWKIILAATVPAGQVLPPFAAVGLRFHARSAMAGEWIPRRCFVRAGVSSGNNEWVSGSVVGGQTLYAPGRSLELTAENPNAFPIWAQYGTDEATAGFSFWTDFEEITTAIEVQLDLPTFTHTFTVYSLSSGAPANLRGYNAAGTLVFQTVLAVGQSADIRNDNGLNYTIQPSVGGPTTYQVLYNCIG